MIVRATAHSRVALLGNPSDGFYGKTVALVVRNFAAEVEVWESPELQIIPDRRNVSTVLRQLPFEFSVELGCRGRAFGSVDPDFLG